MVLWYQFSLGFLYNARYLDVSYTPWSISETVADDISWVSCRLLSLLQEISGIFAQTATFVFLGLTQQTNIYMQYCLKKCSRETLSILLKSPYRKNKEFLKWNDWRKLFVRKISNRVIFIKIWTPFFTFYFWLLDLWRKWWTCFENF